MNSTDFKGRPACIYDGWCHVGCPTGALANPTVTYLGEARKAKAEVRALCTVTRVLTNQQGTRVTGVEYYDDKKQKQVQEANVVVLAAWSAQNPRIMLNSATDKHPKGLANANWSRRQIHDGAHHRRDVSAMFDEDIQNHLGTIGAQYMSYDRYGKTQLQVRVRQHLHRRRSRAEDARLRQLASRSVRRRPARLHEAGGARLHPRQHVRRGIAEPREPHRAGERQGCLRHAARPPRAQLTIRTPSPVAGQCRGGTEGRQGRRRQGSLGRARHPDQPPARRHHHGHRRGATRSSTATARPTRFPISGSPDRASSRPKAPRTRPTRSSRSRCAAPSSWRRAGAPSPTDRAKA